MNNRRSLANTADHNPAIDALKQTLEIRIRQRVIAYYRVLDADTETVINQSSYRVQHPLLVQDEVVLILEIQKQFRLGRFHYHAIAFLHPRHVSTITAWMR